MIFIVNPISGKGRKKRIEALANEERTMIFYESPYRVVKCLEQLSEVFGAEREVAVTREISKMFEETVRGTLSEAIQHFTAHAPKGEFVIVVAGKSSKADNKEQSDEE